MTTDSQTERKQDLFVLGLVAGLCFGGVVAGLLTPRSGADNREVLRDRTTETRDRVTGVFQRKHPDTGSPL